MIGSRVLWSVSSVIALCLAASGLPAQDATAPPKVAKIGQLAPDFKLKDLKGKEVQLSKFKDKIVVLEWFNPECPSVTTAHGKGGSLRKLPQTMIKKHKVVWLAVNSGAPGEEGTGLSTNKKYARKYRMRYPVLLDEKGKVGRSYGATVTPEIFIIGKDRKLVYRGAEDNHRDVDAGRADDYVNYVDAVIGALVKKEKPRYTKTKPEG